MPCCSTLPAAFSISAALEGDPELLVEDGTSAQAAACPMHAVDLRGSLLAAGGRDAVVRLFEFK